MPTGVRYPAALPGCLQENFQSTREDNRSAFEPSAGRQRRRNTMRDAPYITQACFMYTAAQYTYFDQWWNEDILGGAREFDIELPLNYNGLVWFTCEALEYSAEEVSGGFWRVAMTLRSKYGMFFDRPAGTDELNGTASVGIRAARGRIETATLLYGKASGIGVQTAKGRLLPTGLYGKASGIGVQTARGRFFGTPNNLKGKAVIVVTARGELEVG